MRNLKLALTAGITALALAAAPVATAQSSLSSAGSSALGSSEGKTLTPEEANLKAFFDNRLQASGFEKDSKSEKEAEKLVSRALAGELNFYYNTAQDSTFRSYGQVHRFPHEEVAELGEVEVRLPGFTGSPSYGLPYGTAVDSDDEYVYIAISIAYTSVFW